MKATDAERQTHPPDVRWRRSGIGPSQSGRLLRRSGASLRVPTRPPRHTLVTSPESCLPAMGVAEKRNSSTDPKSAQRSPATFEYTSDDVGEMDSIRRLSPRAGQFMRRGVVVAEEAEAERPAGPVRGDASGQEGPLGFVITLVVALAVFAGVALLFHAQTYSSPVGHRGSHRTSGRAASTGSPCST